MHKESQHDNKQTREDFLRKICTSHFIVRVRKGLLRIWLWEGVGDRIKTAIYWPPLLWPSALSFSFSWCSTGGPGAHSAGFLYCILSPTGLVPKLHQGSRGPLRPGVAFPTTSRLYHIWSPTVWLPVLTELYNSSTPTQSPTQSLEWHVWLSSSRNNSCSSEVTLFWCISLWVYHGNFTVSHFVSEVHLRDFSS